MKFRQYLLNEPVGCHMHYKNRDSHLSTTAAVAWPIPANDKGLPHCLEHLCFMGTENHARGYLDTLAVRCLSRGTNAFTASDHTGIGSGLRPFRIASQGIRCWLQGIQPQSNFFLCVCFPLGEKIKWVLELHCNFAAPHFMCNAFFLKYTLYFSFFFLHLFSLFSVYSFDVAGSTGLLRVLPAKAAVCVLFALHW